MGIDTVHHYKFFPELDSVQVNELIENLKEKNYSPKYFENENELQADCNLETLKEILPNVLIISECIAECQYTFTEILRKLSNGDEYFIVYDGPFGEDIYITIDNKTYHIYRVYKNKKKAFKYEYMWKEKISSKYEDMWTQKISSKYTKKDILEYLESNGVDIHKTTTQVFEPQCIELMKKSYGI